MLENLIISIEAVLPMFLIIFLGILIRKKGYWNENDAKKANKIVFNFCFPCLMFCNLYGTDIEEAVDLKMIVYAVLMVLVICAITALFVMKIEKNNKSRGAMVQAIYRSNFVIMGLPIVRNIFNGGDIGITTVAITVIVPLYNILAVIILELYRGKRPELKRVLINIVKNPLIIGAVAGILVTAADITLPIFLFNTIESLKNLTTPFALIVLGASLNRMSIEKCKRNLVICLIGRLIVVPAIGLSVAVFIGIRGVGFVTLIALFASPVGVSSYPMAVQMDSDGELAGNCVVFSSIFATVTMFLWIFIFKTLEIF